MFNPVSTYRIQFHKEFNFQQFKQIIPYLQKLGITTIYASPIFEAVPGSVHGYDCTNPLRINPEIGTIEELRDISQQLKECGMCWLQDIVPNHMAFHSNNQWLMDVLKNGRNSEFASYFDINWKEGEKLMVPFLGKSLEEAVNNDELKIIMQADKPVVDYFGSQYPLSDDSIQNFLQDNNINNDKQRLVALLQSQHYRLCHWQETDHHINYRRFFTVNGLICLNMQDEKVFAHHHSFLKQLLDEGIIQGIRIDHIDGLNNPRQYLERLRKLAGEEVYIVAEKILEPGEELPAYWPLQGTTGYDFLSLVNNLLTNKSNKRKFREFYEELTSNYFSVHHQLRSKKALILSKHMNGELENLYRLFLDLKLIDKRSLSGITTEDLKSALGEFLIQCPVYRYYGNSFPLNKKEEEEIRKILHQVKRSGESPQAVHVLETVFLNRPHENNEELNERIATFYMRCMQFTGPLMAKGVEDTFMYTYDAFIGHNEVGDSPESFGLSKEIFHQHMLHRQQQWPFAMNATATHDTKRGEDVRARLNVLADMGERWLAKVQEWMQLNAHLKKQNIPDINDEYFIYQALVGHYDLNEENDFENRFKAYLQKALREGKSNSDWSNPDEEYENTTGEFVTALLDRNTDFWKSFQQFLEEIHQHSLVNSLAQVLLKFTLPGVPDTYQGCELWDYSFVDPDNRRPVDYNKRIELLNSFEGDNDELLPSLWKERNGAIKLWLTQQILSLRKGDKNLFAEGDYIPLQTEGKYKKDVFAFARKQADKAYLFAVPLGTAMISAEANNFFKIDWQDTRILIPQEFGGFSDVLSGQTIGKADGLLAKNLFKKFTVAILKGKQSAKDRGAGILLHITSLHSPFGVGDLGPGAKAFADFLHRSGQKYWQLLPINPTEEGQGYSPYSALSSRAGWPLLISPELLVRDGLLNADELTKYHQSENAVVDYGAAENAKKALFESAFQAFVHQANEVLQNEFNLFCEKEKSWLNDFALFMLLKKQNEGKPWFEWNERLKKRNEEALRSVEAEHHQALQKIKWLQFIFAKQWMDFKIYCNNRNIKLIGDMPFYVSYDSADVWSAQQLFSLDENGNKTGVAGVPPDAFSDDGQLWGMPTFNWKKIKAEEYNWWIQRLRKNIELFDLTRLDHFRAFEAYWEVPPGEETAKNGKWIPGPSEDFFKALQKEFGELPFIAEDLGDINEDVLNLRDSAHLPGMRVLQFAFGEDMHQSAYIPHNYDRHAIAYTGTHDNNTTVGWWKNDIDHNTKERISNYVGYDVNENNVHSAFIRLVYSSVANIAILPMQDVLGLDEKSRMNKPSSAKDNWGWRLSPGQPDASAENFLRQCVHWYNRE